MSHEMRIKEGDYMSQKVTVAEAARRMGKAPQFVRLCMQRGLLPIGTATKTGKKNWNYYISPKLLDEYIGKENVDEQCD